MRVGNPQCQSTWRTVKMEVKQHSLLQYSDRFKKVSYEIEYCGY